MPSVAEAISCSCLCRRQLAHRTGRGGGYVGERLKRGSQLTNVLRCLYLESQGYAITVTELVGWEHSLKNELILARYTGQKKHTAGQRLRELLESIGLKDWGIHRYPLATS